MSKKNTSKVTKSRPLPGRIKVEIIPANVSQNSKELYNKRYNQYMQTRSGIRHSPIVVPDQAYNYEYNQPVSNNIQTIKNRTFSPITTSNSEISLSSSSSSDLSKRSSSPLTMQEYVQSINDENNMKYSDDEWGIHDKNFHGGSKNRNKNRKKRATKKRIRNMKRQTRRKK